MVFIPEPILFRWSNKGRWDCRNI